MIVLIYKEYLTAAGSCNLIFIPLNSTSILVKSVLLLLNSCINMV